MSLSSIRNNRLSLKASFKTDAARLIFPKADEWKSFNISGSSNLNINHSQTTIDISKEILSGFEKQLEIIAQYQFVQSQTKIEKEVRSTILQLATDIGKNLEINDTASSSHIKQDQMRLLGRYLAQFVAAMNEPQSSFHLLNQNKTLHSVQTNAQDYTIEALVKSAISLIFLYIKDFPYETSSLKPILLAKDSIAKSISLDDKSIELHCTKILDKHKANEIRISNHVLDLQRKITSIQERATIIPNRTEIELELTQLDITEEDLKNRIKKLQSDRKERDNQLSDSAKSKMQEAVEIKKRLEYQFESLNTICNKIDNLNYRIQKIRNDRKIIFSELRTIRNQIKNNNLSSTQISTLKKKEAGKWLKIRNYRGQRLRLRSQINKLGPAPELSKIQSLKDEIKNISSSLGMREEDKIKKEIALIHNQRKLLKLQIVKDEKYKDDLEEHQLVLKRSQDRLLELRKVSHDEIRKKIELSLATILEKRAYIASKEWTNKLLPSIIFIASLDDNPSLTKMIKIDRLIQDLIPLKDFENTSSRRRDILIDVLQRLNNQNIKHISKDMLVSLMIIAHYFKDNATPNLYESSLDRVNNIIINSEKKITKLVNYSLNKILAKSDPNNMYELLNLVTEESKWSNEAEIAATVATIRQINKDKNHPTPDHLRVVWNSAISWQNWLFTSPAAQSLSNKEKENLLSSLLMVAARSKTAVNSFTLKQVENALLNTPKGNDSEVFFYRYAMLVGDQSWLNIKEADEYIRLFSSVRVIPSVIDDSFHNTYGLIARYPKHYSSLISNITRKYSVNQNDYADINFFEQIYNAIISIANILAEDASPDHINTIFDLLIENPTTSIEAYALYQRAPSLVSKFVSWRLTHSNLVIPLQLFTAIPKIKSQAVVYFDEILANPQFLLPLQTINSSNNVVARLIADHLRSYQKSTFEVIKLVKEISNQELSPHKIISHINPSILDKIKTGLLQIKNLYKWNQSETEQIQQTLNGLTRIYGGPNAIAPISEQLVDLDFKLTKFMDNEFIQRRQQFPDITKKAERAYKQSIYKKLVEVDLLKSSNFTELLSIGFSKIDISESYFDTLINLNKFINNNVKVCNEHDAVIQDLRVIMRISGVKNLPELIESALNIIQAEIETQLPIIEVPLQNLIKELRIAIESISNVYNPNPAESTDRLEQIHPNNRTILTSRATHLYKALQNLKIEDQPLTELDLQIDHEERYIGSFLPKRKWELIFGEDLSAQKLRSDIVQGIFETYSKEIWSKTHFKKILNTLYANYHTSSSIEEIGEYLVSVNTFLTELSSCNVNQLITFMEDTNYLLESLKLFYPELTLSDLTEIIYALSGYIADANEEQIPIETAFELIKRIEIKKNNAGYSKISLRRGKNPDIINELVISIMEIVNLEHSYQPAPQVNSEDSGQSLLKNLSRLYRN